MRIESNRPTLPIGGRLDHNHCALAARRRAAPLLATLDCLGLAFHPMNVSSSLESPGAGGPPSASDPSEGPAAVDKSDRRVRRMFASIAGRYDLLNHLLSLNIDRSWRTFTTRMVPPEPGVPVLDCCTGTADLALAYDRAGRGRSPIVGTDFCREMLEIGP